MMWQEGNVRYKLLASFLLSVILLVVLTTPSFPGSRFYMICPDKVKSLLKTSIKVTGWVYTEKASLPDGLILEIPHKIRNFKVIDVQNIRGIFDPSIHFKLIQSISLRDRYVLVFKRIGSGDLYVRISLLDESSILPYICELQYWGVSGAPK